MGMKKRKNLMAKIVSAIALFAIFLGIVGTGVLFVVSSLSNSSQNQELSKEDLQKLLESMSWSITVGTGSENASSSENTSSN